MFIGMKIIGDSGASETMLPYHHLFLKLTVPRHNLTVVLVDGTPVPADGVEKYTFYVYDVIYRYFNK